MTWLDFVGPHPIQHLGNHGVQKKLGTWALPLDGWCATTGTAYQFHGDYIHGHQDPRHGDKYAPHTICPHRTKNHKPMTFGEVYQETCDKMDYLHDLLGGPEKVVEIWECECLDMKKQPQARLGGKTIEEWLSQKEHFQFTRTPYRRMSVSKLLDDVKSKKFFGTVECDVEVPERLREKFAEFQPLFKNTEVTRDDLSPHMLDYAQQYNMMRSPTRLLVGSFFAKKCGFITPLLKWYLEHGLVVTRVYRAFQYSEKACFQEFADMVADA